jgi:hypothetical protein
MVDVNCLMNGYVGYIDVVIFLLDDMDKGEVFGVIFVDVNPAYAGGQAGRW